MDGTLSRYYARFLFVSLFFFTFSTAVAVVVTTAVGGEVSLWEGRRYQTRPVPLDDARLPTEPLNGPPFSMKETHRSFRSNVDPTSVLFFFLLPLFSRLPSLFPFFFLLFFSSRSTPLRSRAPSLFSSSFRSCATHDTATRPLETSSLRLSRHRTTSKDEMILK